MSIPIQQYYTMQQQMQQVQHYHDQQNQIPPPQNPIPENMNQNQNQDIINQNNNPQSGGNDIINYNNINNDNNIRKPNTTIQKLQQGFTEAGVLAQQAAVKLKQTKQKMQNQFTSFQQDFQNIMLAKKDQIKVWMKGKLQHVAEELMKKGRPGLKHYFKDPYMPLFAKDVVDDIVDETWPVIEANIMDSLGVIELSENAIMEHKQPSTCQKINPWYYLRRWYCYSVQPYDRSIWYCFKTFSFWLFFLLKIFPLYSVQNYFYIFVFLAIDKTDEWQLVKYILEFKAFQFLSVGCFNSIIGYGQFYACATLNNYKTDEESLECTKNGPQAQLYDAIGFGVIILLGWISYSLLPCAKPKGQWKPVYVRKLNEQDYEVNEEADCCCCQLSLDKGGRLKGFLIYDFIVMIFCAGLYGILIFLLEKNDGWQQRQILYMVKTIYGLFMFPFILFIVPQFNEILTRCRETGYDKLGNCVPRFIDDPSKKRDKQNKEKNKDLLEQIDDIDFK